MEGDQFVDNLRESYNRYPVQVKNKYLLLVYDFMVYAGGNFPHKPANTLVRQICKRFHLKGKKILDAGSFTGYHSFYFHCEGNQVTGVELSNKVEYARKRYSFYNIEFISGDINEHLLHLADRKFDFIFSSNLPVHYDTGSVLTSPSFDSFIERALGCLMPDGNLFYAFYASKHDKVALPVNEGELRDYCIYKKLKNYTIARTNLLGNDTIELIVKPQKDCLKMHY